MLEELIPVIRSEYNQRLLFESKPIERVQHPSYMSIGKKDLSVI